MRTIRITAICLTVSLILAAIPAFGAAEQASNTRSASCVVRITVDPQIMPLDAETIHLMIYGSRVARQAIRDVFEPDTEHMSRIVRGIGVTLLESERSSERVLGNDAETDYSMDNTVMKGYYETYNNRYTERFGKKRSEAQEPTGAEPQEPSSRVGGMRTMGSSGMMRGGTGMGMGGMGGGMMGGYGMGGYGGYGGMAGTGMGGTPVTPEPQIVMIRLEVGLPDEVEPKARELLEVLVRHLRQAMQNAYDRQEQLLGEQIEFLTERYNATKEQLEDQIVGTSAESRRIREQLNTSVDVSVLSPEMPFSQAVEILRNSVEPPLPIVVLWKELEECCGIVADTPIGMDGLPVVKLETALRMVIAAVSGGLSDISYQIDEDVLVIREEELQKPLAEFATSDLRTNVEELTKRWHELSREIENLEMEIASAEARGQAIEEQIERTRRDTDLRLAQDTVTQEFERLIRLIEERLLRLRKQVDAGQAPTSELGQTEENLTRARIELAKRKEELSKSVGGGRLDELNSQLSQMAIQMAETRARLDMLRAQLSETERRQMQAVTRDPQVQRLRATRRALDTIEQQIGELTQRRVRLQRPTVTTLTSDAS